MRYQEYEPPNELAPWVKLFWVFESRCNVSVPETIVADGFPELIIHFHSPFTERDRTGQMLQQPAAIACGQLTRPLVLHSSLDAGMVGIRFHPTGMSPFVSTPMQSLTDARVSADDVFDDIDQLTEAVLQSSSDTQRIAACSRYLLRCIDPDRENLSVRRAVQQIMHTGGRISVNALATLMGRSRRSLELAFQRDIGTSPKMYCQITRFRQIFDAISEDGMADDWIRVALDSGFFDQSHLIRDFRRFAGSSPTSFLAERTRFAHSVNQT